MTDKSDQIRLILVTGPSGAGRTTAIRALEDNGYEVIDNMPLTLVPAMLTGAMKGTSLALGVDVRNRDFSISYLIEVIEDLVWDPAVDLQILYLDCALDVLLRRFSETRRKHPLAHDETPFKAVRRELEMMTPIQTRADVVVDTSTLSPHDLKAEVERWFADSETSNMAVSVQSFSYKRGMPRSVDMMFDCRVLRNPHWDEALRPLTGQDKPVHDYIAKDDAFDEFVQRIYDYLTLVLPLHAQEGRAYVSIAFGCTGGQHRSVALAEDIFKRLSAKGEWHVSLRHRELERQGVLLLTTQNGKQTA